jgi:hypothetical protein
MSDGRLQWSFAEDEIYMMHQYARLVEQQIHCNVGYYISQHPDIAHLPIDSVVKAFHNSPDEQGLLDSRCPDLSTMMTQLPHFRERWFQEKMGIEAISRDLGDPNLFLTVNFEPRASPDVRELLYELEHGEPMPVDRPYDRNTDKYTELVSKFAVFVSIYLARKLKKNLRAF